ncbi:MAG TPA: hypothetical protein VFI03_09370 [Solirubrobacterales bacterium]|nr:hypothetical protein [Solirubrobacterales bacterium]
MRALTLALLCFSLLTGGLWLAQAGTAEDPPSAADRVEELQQELDSLTEDIEDLKEPVNEFDLFDECMYLIGVSELGRPKGTGYFFGAKRRPALALDIRGFGQPQFNFLAFPGEEPPSIECNEDAEQEFIDE